MKIFHAKGACSIGSLMVLEEAGLDYDLVVVDLAGREQASPEYLPRNPKAKAPLLELNDSGYLTVWPAIAAWPARLALQRGLLPDDPLGLARTLEAVDYVVSTMHMKGFTRTVRPGLFTPNEAEFDAVKARGLEIVEQGLALLDGRLADPDYLMGDTTIADAALVYVEHWMVARMGLPIPPHCQAQYARMLGREAVQRSLEPGD